MHRGTFLCHVQILDDGIRYIHKSFMFMCMQDQQEVKEVTKGWHLELGKAVDGLSEELGLDDFSKAKLRDFIFEKAKEQYKMGNRSGIRWARSCPSPMRQGVDAASV